MLLEKRLDVGVPERYTNSMLLYLQGIGYSARWDRM
jgi:hypothetical protein